MRTALHMKSSSSASRQLRSYFLIVGIALPILLPFLFVGYNGDDWQYLPMYDEISFETVTGILSGRIVSETNNPHYTPLLFLLLAIGYSLFPPLSMHALSIALHVLNGLLLYRLLRKLLDMSETAAVVSSLLFLFWPTISMTVFWFPAIGDLLCTFFVLLSFDAYLSGSRETGPTLIPRIVFVFAMFFSLLSKEMAVTVPALILVYALSRKMLGRSLFFLVTSILCCVLLLLMRIAVFGVLVSPEHRAYYFSPDAHIFLSAAKYFVAFLLPIPPHIGAKYPLLYLAAGLPLWAALHLWRKHPQDLRHSLFWLVCMLIALAPIISVFSFWYLYLPSVFGFLSLAAAARPFLQRNFIVKLWALAPIPTAAIFVSVGINYLRSIPFQQEILSQVSAVPSRRVSLLHVPIAAYSFVPLFSNGTYISSALKYFYSVDKEVEFVTQGMAEGLSPTPKLRMIEVQPEQTFSASPSLRYFSPPLREPIGHRVSYSNHNFLGAHPATCTVHGDSSFVGILIDQRFDRHDTDGPDGTPASGRYQPSKGEVGDDSAPKR